jgi:hypothetical protein
MSALRFYWRHIEPAFVIGLVLFAWAMLIYWALTV